MKQEVLESKTKKHLATTFVETLDEEIHFMEYVKQKDNKHMSYCRHLINRVINRDLDKEEAFFPTRWTVAETIQFFRDKEQ